MFRSSSLVRGAAAIAALSLLPLLAVATPAQEKTEKRKARKEIADVFKRWQKEDVIYIISPEEKAVFEKLATDEEREQFIEQFWLRRDPDPNTPENEFREEHYRRIAYANQHFSSGIPGWKTDRGRVYIAWGKPDGIDSYPTGTQYNRPMWEGGGSTTTHAFEVWWYRHLDGVGDDIELEFVDRSGTGEYRLSLDPQEKDALRYVANAGLTEWEALGISNKADRVNGTPNNNFVPHNKTQFARLETWAAVLRGPGDSTKFKDIPTILAGDPTIETNPLPFSVRTDFYRVGDQTVATALTVQLDNSDLVFTEKGGIYKGTVNVFAIITQLSGRSTGRFEEVIETPNFDAQTLALGQQQKSAFQKVISMAPGNYKVEVIARDVNSGKTGVVRQSFLVPRYQEAKLSTSSVVLASRIEQVTNRVAAGQFFVGRFKVLPNVSNTVRVGQPVNLFIQVYDTQEDQTTLRPSLQIDYVVMLDGKEVKRVTDNYPTESATPVPGVLFDLAGRQLALARSIPLAGLAPGSYTLKVTVTDRVAQKSVTPEAEFTIVE